MKKKKVLFFIYQMGAGGAARTILNIVNHLDRKQFEPILVTLNYNGSYESYLHDDIKFIKLHTKRLRSAIIPLAKLIRKEKIDLVFSTIPNYNIVAILARLLSFSKAKNIVREAAFLGGTTRSNLKLRFVGWIYKFSSRVISLSKGVKENIIARYHVPEEKITVIYNPVDIGVIEKNIENGQIHDDHKHIFDGQSKVIITAGRLVNDKDHQTLIEAFANVQPKLNTKLVILGEGELEAQLKKQVQALNIEDHVYFLGFMENPYVYFAHADLFVLSSLKEGFGHVLAEALATGVPIVSTACRPGAVEVLNDGEYGKLCEIGNANDMAEKMYDVLSLTNDERFAMINKGLSRANQFAASEIVKQYEEVFRQTLMMEKEIVARS
ncbi:N-acetylgalactosamine-N,N'-diacetylbacillosaminyl-diphospho-undecaprenol 4-alpha-N-acetylgalactosaminyltransferase [Ornithinibacillus halotolerans]|uniref:N-acetylgalactosamine-N, N'-diacetylbacillosaminyl-diphospho-undecaprenol 4-alpha-N-acetylgalactosaminyltransferase n=2 Tax=Ornithinibacillus halotolerans TaxID=1274357 RepID=A0A916RPW5_9BACI|nr:N-acetylgalactosamine-N,N'-diacetylbacillosaminyl-diphospho-undecaprenol 4-alpha-N-acetylgalactosaminyltransferase [Ornithinibacillus halotolerans]